MKNTSPKLDSHVTRSRSDKLRERKAKIDTSNSLGQPLRFIDEQEMRETSGINLRKIVHAHVRRDTYFKKQRRKAAMRDYSIKPRQILTKDTHVDQSALDQNTSKALSTTSIGDEQPGSTNKSTDSGTLVRRAIQR